MLKNINHNILETIVIISDSLYRYEEYIRDAEKCETCQELWPKFKEHRENELSMLLKELKKHIEGGLISFD
jgi:hypothetical protein